MPAGREKGRDAVVPARAKSSGVKVEKYSRISAGGRGLKRRPHAPLRWGDRCDVEGGVSAAVEERARDMTFVLPKKSLRNPTFYQTIEKITVNPKGSQKNFVRGDRYRCRGQEIEREQQKNRYLAYRPSLISDLMSLR